MTTLQPQQFEPFAIQTPRLIILPTPIAVSSNSYRALYAELHANEQFCQIAFGEHFKARRWSDDETREVIETRDIARCWKPRGLGDFALGLRESIYPEGDAPCPLGIPVVKSSELEKLIGPKAEHLNQVQWVGYAGVRDATTTSLPPRELGDPSLPPWNEMVELRYGLAPDFWGKGIAKEAAEAIMQWAVNERGVKRFIAETERGNVQSARLLQKLGFVESGTDYWKEPSEVEWAMVVNQSMVMKR